MIISTTTLTSPLMVPLFLNRTANNSDSSTLYCQNCNYADFTCFILSMPKYDTVVSCIDDRVSNITRFSTIFNTKGNVKVMYDGQGTTITMTKARVYMAETSQNIMNSVCVVKSKGNTSGQPSTFQ